MKKWLKFEWGPMLLAVLIIGVASCTEKEKKGNALALGADIEKPMAPLEVPKRPLTQDFKDYWYAGDAEITSYTLEQARYGEIREGKAVLIYVTEPFLPKVQVKADQNSPTNIPVLKLNKTKKYLTGIYPYSIMSSTFYPVHDNQHAVKTGLSIQEWCGHIYSQINNRETFEYTSHSYFEGEADQQLNLEKALLENEIWNKVRIAPNNLPVGEIAIIPALEYFRVQHKPVKAYSAIATLASKDGISTYSIDYVDTDRKLTLNFSTTFPHQIESWEEEFKSGYGPNAKVLVSRGTKLKTLKTPYWRQNSNEFVRLRDSLGL